MAAGAQRLHELAVQKEQELQRLREQQQHALEHALKSCQVELGKQKARERELEQDFRYNLSLIQQRDEELAKYELAFSELKKVVNGHISETSDLKVQLDEANGRVQHLEEEKQQLKQYYINRLDQQQRQLDAYRAAKDEELSHQHREYEALQCKLQQRLVQVEEELAVQKLQLVNQFDEVSKKQEHEHRVKMDQLSGVVMSKEAQLRQLQRELVVAQSTAQQNKQDSSEVAERVRDIERKMREKEWDYTDSINAKNTRITELESQLSHSRTALTALQSDCELRCAELERAGKEKEKVLLAAKEAHGSREHELESTIRELQVTVEQHEAERRKRQWEVEDLIKEKQIAIERLHEEVTRVKEKEQEQVALLNQDKVALDLQHQTLQQSYQSARTELGRKREEIERYKRDLRLAAEKERRMERNKAQLELDWQRRLEENEREVCSRQDELIKAVTKTRDEAVAHCAELESKLSEQTQLCGVLQRERASAMRTLRDNGLAVTGEGEEEDGTSLRQQNQELRAVIHEMRREMERVSKEQTSGGETAGYVQYLETQVTRLKSTQQHLTEQLRTTAHKPPTPPASGRGQSRGVTTPPASEQRTCKNTAVVAALNKTLIALQKEKSTFELDMAQLRSRVRQLEGTVTSQREEEYFKRAMNVPSSKVHQKLLQATHVIIQLVKERELLLERELALKNELNRVLESRGNDENCSADRQEKQQDTVCSCGSETAAAVGQQTNRVSCEEVHHQPTQERSRESRRTSHTRSSSDLSLSPLKFSDASGISALLDAERALNMVDDSLPPSSPPVRTHSASTPVVRRPEDHHQQLQVVDEALLVHGSRVSRAGRGRGRTKFVAPKLRKPVRPTVRNYNDKE